MKSCVGLFTSCVPPDHVADLLKPLLSPPCYYDCVL